MINAFKNLQKYLKKNKIDYVLIDTFDPHGSEYINDYYKARQFFSGFTGSNGLFLCGQNDAYLWTDGRYFIQAEKELYKGIKLMKIGEKNVPNIYDFISDKSKKGQTIAADFNLISANMGIKLNEIAKKHGCKIINDNKFIDELWNDRPKDSAKKAFILDEMYAGESLNKKIARVRKNLKTDLLFISKLDEIMWLLNIRGNDILCNPVCYSFVLLNKKSIKLFINKKSLSKELNDYLAANDIEIYDYKKTNTLLPDILNACIENAIRTDFRFLSYEIYNILNIKSIKNVISDIDIFKAVKNKTEIKNIKECYLADSLVVTRFAKYIKEHNTISEIEAAETLDKMRAKLPGFLGLSFPTISAYGSNAAMMHYEATNENFSYLKPEGMYLVDSGGQYYTGTTDVTRTIVLGPVNDNMKKHFTLTAVSMLRLLNTVFMKGCTGRNLDIVSRQVMWKEGIDYKCGTGHGIGYLLNVHEGPQNIGWQKRVNGIEAVLEKGMIISDEPGVYIEGEYGIRTETIVLVEDYKKTSDGEFLHFVPLTFVPIDLDAIDTKYMNDEDIKMLNEYHSLCYKKLSPLLNKEELVWLKNMTKKI